MGALLAERANVTRGGVSRFLRAAIISMCAVLASLALAVAQPTGPAFAADGTPVLEMTVKTGIDQRTFVVSIQPDSYTDYYGNTSLYYEATASLKSGSVKLALANDDEKPRVTVKNLRPDLVDSSSISYDKQIKPGYGYGIFGSLSFFVYGADAETSCSFYLDGNVSPVFSLKAATNVSSKGFNPSKGNSLTLYALLGANTAEYNLVNHETRATLTMRVLNSKGKAVYSYSAKNTVIFDTCTLQWNGKASKKNPAKVKAGSYVKPGTYTLEVAVTCTRDGEVISQLKDRAKFKVSKRAPKGVKGRAKAKALVLLTGDPRVDYLAERMLKEAGVKQSMSADKKVKKIYAYMTKKFTHNRGDKKWKLRYNLKKLKNQVAKYQKSADAKVAKGKAYYTYKFYDSTMMDFDPYWGLSGTMAYRAGVCDDMAAVFEVLCNHAGVEAYKYNGYYVNSNGKKMGHAWNSAIVNGKEYFYDVDVEIQNRGKGQGNYYWYKKTLAQTKKNHKFL